MKTSIFIVLSIIAIWITAVLTQQVALALPQAGVRAVGAKSANASGPGSNSAAGPADQIGSEIAFWRELHPTTSPPARDLTAMVYDQARGRMVMFGGRTANYTFLNDTWEFNGTAWIQRLPANSPSARTSHTMAYDSVRQRVVLFGGFDGGWPADTWEWDGFTF